MKRVPISERLAAKLVKEHDSNLTGVVEEERTVFYTADKQPIFAMTKIYDASNQNFWYSYEAFFEEYKGD